MLDPSQAESSQWASQWRNVRTKSNYQCVADVGSWSQRWWGWRKRRSWPASGPEKLRDELGHYWDPQKQFGRKRNSIRGCGKDVRELRSKLWKIKWEKIHIYQQLNLKTKLSKQEEQRRNHGYGKRRDGCQMGGIKIAKKRSNRYQKTPGVLIL